MALARVFAQLSRGLLAEHICGPLPHIHKSTLADCLQSLQNLSHKTPTRSSCQRGLHAHEGPLSQVSSTVQSSAAAARNSLTQSNSRCALLPVVPQTQQQLQPSGRLYGIAPALVRGWRPGSARVGSSHLTPSAGSPVRAFASQAQRSQQRRQLQKKSSEQGVYLVALVVGMVGLTYASVPLYRCAADSSWPRAST